VFCRIIDGLGSREIARSLSISLKTVESHRSHINRKLGVHSPAELIRLAALKGLLAGQGGGKETPSATAA
jgi:DNA-binding CsgD family transcriptional regulator